MILFLEVMFVIITFVLNIWCFRTFVAPSGVSACTLVVCDSTGSDLSELLCFGNFGGPSAGIADSCPDKILPTQNLSAVSKGT